jgi:hypothetical protein
VSSTVVHRLVVDGSNNRVYLAEQQGDQFTEIRDELANTALPEGFRLELTDSAGKRLDSVDFYPTGRTQAARVRITTPDGDVAQIECATPTEGYRALAPGEVR